MAGEVYDDVAFYWFMFAALSSIVFPWTLAKGLGLLFDLCCGADDRDPGAAVSLFSGKPVKKKRRSGFSKSNIVFVVLWAVLLAMVVAAPVEEHQEEAFNPYTILGLDPADNPSAKAIKKAFQKASFKVHPDRNPDDPEANVKFSLVSKARDTLTDPKTRENWEKYGNPDGWQGSSSTIGLPSFMADSDNAMPIVSVYILIFCFLIPGAVIHWWSKAKKSDPAGVQLRSLGLFYNYINNEQMAPKFLIEVLTLAIEFEPLGVLAPDSVKAFKALFRSVEDDMGKSTYPKHSVVPPYMRNSRTLVYAYLTRRHIPGDFTPDLDFILSKVHKFLSKMLEVALSKNYLRSSLQIVDLSQCFAQQLTHVDSDLLQLPHLEEGHLRALKRLKITSLDRLVAMSPSERLDVLASVLGADSADQIREVDAICRKFPGLRVSCSHFVKGSDQVVEGDLLSMTVHLRRYTGSLDTADQPEEEQVAAQALEFDEDGFVVENDLASEDPSKLPTVAAHAPRFPHPKAEGWMVILYDETHKHVTAFEKVTSLVEVRDIELKFRAPPAKDAVDYVLYVKSDSYRGIDQEARFTVEVLSKKDVVTEEMLRLIQEDEEDTFLTEEEEEVTYWYYCGLSSFWELLLHVFLIYIIVLLGCDILEQKGYIAKNPFKGSATEDPRLNQDTDKQYYDQD